MNPAIFQHTLFKTTLQCASKIERIEHTRYPRWRFRPIRGRISARGVVFVCSSGCIYIDVRRMRGRGCGSPLLDDTRVDTSTPDTGETGETVKSSLSRTRN